MRECADETTAEAIRKYNAKKQDDEKMKKLAARRKIEDIKLAKEVGLDYDEIKDL